VEIPETKYAKTVDGVHIAYQVRGEGPIDLVFIMGFASNFEVELEDPGMAYFVERLTSMSRVILFDKRGAGLSDRVVMPNLDMRVDDLRAVLDAVGSERVILYGEAEGGALATFFAATYPDRMVALILHGTSARIAWAPDYPTGLTLEDFRIQREKTATGWGSIALAEGWIADEAPTRVGDADYARWFARTMRYGASPAEALAFEDFWYAIDVRSVLGTVQAPTLVLTNPESSAGPRDLAERIPGAKLVELSGRDFISTVSRRHTDAAFETVAGFVQSIRKEEAEIDRVLATVLFTDIVGSTAKAASIGDDSWRSLLERHHEVVRALIGRYRGREIDTAGDGFLATFDGPARAIHCATSIVDAVRDLGLEIRAGLHTGECELMDGKVGGIAVHIGARVGALAGASEVLVSSTVKDLVAGSGLTFEDAGEHELKGVPDRWHLYRVVS
jgi:class 3 adenylate cyclase